jgi:hypothetical protein
MRLCSPHRNGVSPGTPPFFDAKCPACQAKLRIGLVTGKEPTAPRFRTRYPRWGTMYASSPPAVAAYLARRKRMSP